MIEPFEQLYYHLSRLFLVLSRALRADSRTSVPNIHAMQPARVDVCQSSSDSAEAQTETKLRNYTTWLTAHRKASVVVCVFTCVRACVPGGGGTRMEEPTEKAEEGERVEKWREGWKERGDGTLGYPPRANQFRERRARACARAH